MNDISRLIFYLLLSLLLTLIGCRNQQNGSFSFSGEWTIESYRIYSEVDGKILNDQTYEDAGFFRFMNGGSGTATIKIPGISFPENHPISWSYHQESDELTIDYNTGQDPFFYSVSLKPMDAVELLYENIIQSDQSTSLSRTIINLSKNNYSLRE